MTGELRINSVQTTIRHTCCTCYSEIALPDWVSVSKHETAVFECPVCDKECEVDISDYPTHRLSIRPLCQTKSETKLEP